MLGLQLLMTRTVINNFEAASQQFAENIAKISQPQTTIFIVAPGLSNSQPDFQFIYSKS